MLHPNVRLCWMNIRRKWIIGRCSVDGTHEWTISTIIMSEKQMITAMRLFELLWSQYYLWTLEHSKDWDSRILLSRLRKIMSDIKWKILNRWKLIGTNSWGFVKGGWRDTDPRLRPQDKGIIQAEETRIFRV